MFILRRSVFPAGLFTSGPADRRKHRSALSVTPFVPRRRTRSYSTSSFPDAPDKYLYERSGIPRCSPKNLSLIHISSNSHAQGDADKSSGMNSAAASQSGNIISASRAKHLALAQVPGASERDIHEFEVDNDDGRIEYEGKIYYNNMEYVFEIDAYSGAFRSWEAEPIDD